jgi:endonuclease-8
MHTVRIVLTTAHRVAVGFHLHDIALVPSAEEDALVGHLGPDLLGADWYPAEAVRRLAAAPEREIGTALLDQRNLAGIGNLYKAEVLFLRGIWPWRHVGDVPDLERLVDLAQRLLHANRERWPQITTGDTRRGRQNYVFERAGQPCLRCGTMVRRARQGDAPTEDRVTYWCPVCQPE